MGSVTPNLCSSGVLECFCSPLWGFLGVRIQPCQVRASVNINTQELIWKNKKTLWVFFFQLAVQQLCISSLILLNASAVREACLELRQMWKIEGCGNMCK